MRVSPPVVVVVVSVVMDIPVVGHPYDLIGGGSTVGVDRIRNGRAMDIPVVSAMNLIGTLSTAQLHVSGLDWLRSLGSAVLGGSGRRAVPNCQCPSRVLVGFRGYEATVLTLKPCHSI